MTDDRPDLIPTLIGAIGDRYEIKRELGRGGMATVYLANDVKHGREVAIKVLLPAMSATLRADRFEREIRTAAKLQHPHVLGLFDSGVAGDLLYYYYEHNMSVEEAASIDTSKCMLYFLTGEYDPNTSPAETRAIAELVKGCKFSPMPKLGHFPHCENYPEFRKFLLPILDEIAAKGA